MALVLIAINPETHAVVPLYATAKMLVGPEKAGTPWHIAQRDYKLMLAAAPPPPLSPDDAIVDPRTVTLLRLIFDALTCGKDGAHYCPNCDHSLYNVREEVRAAIAALAKEGE